MKLNFPRGEMIMSEIQQYLPLKKLQNLENQIDDNISKIMNLKTSLKKKFILK